jgi:hypothetical protein
MNDGNQKSLIIIIVVAILLGIGVLFFKNNYAEKPYNEEYNLLTNREYYPNITELNK